jgi:predicted glycoside hydrolase/deacetylase ChbG (UPF0249 family)
MIIINADDFGRSRPETDAALLCFKEGRITSATAMVFMEDSERAAEMAGGVGMEVGLHLNLCQEFTALRPGRLQEHHRRVVQFLTRSPYSLLFYNPVLRREFRYVYEAQLEEFVRLYRRRPTHIDGHRHRHLCSNVLIGRLIAQNERVRRSFSFWPGEKGMFNRGYRRLVDFSLSRRYRVTDFFFALRQCLEANRMTRVFDLARSSSVELMTHPVMALEYDYLLSDRYISALRQLTTVSYSAL